MSSIKEFAIDKRLSSDGRIQQILREVEKGQEFGSIFLYKHLDPSIRALFDEPYLNFLDKKYLKNIKKIIDTDK